MSLESLIPGEFTPQLRLFHWHINFTAELRQNGIKVGFLHNNYYLVLKIVVSECKPLKKLTIDLTSIRYTIQASDFIRPKSNFGKGIHG